MYLCIILHYYVLKFLITPLKIKTLTNTDNVLTFEFGNRSIPVSIRSNIKVYCKKFELINLNLIYDTYVVRL